MSTEEPTGDEGCGQTPSARLTGPLRRVEGVPPVPVRSPLPPDESRPRVEGAHHRHDERADDPKELGLRFSFRSMFGHGGSTGQKSGRGYNYNGRRSRRESSPVPSSRASSRAPRSRPPRP